MVLRLICTDGSLEAGPGHLVDGKSYRLGRSSRCSFIVKEQSVSRFHAELTIDAEGIRIKDLNSRNGTYVDGVRVEEAQVKAGQAVRFGAVQFHVIAYDQPGDDAREVSEVSTFFVHTKPSVQPAAVDLLSRAERRVLDQLLTGVSEKQAATKLKLSPNTVHNHIKAIYRKLGVTSRAEMLALFVAEDRKPGK